MTPVQAGAADPGRTVAWLAAALLVTAAAMKSLQLSQAAAMPVGPWLWPRWAGALAITAEGLLAGVFLLRHPPALVRRLGGGLFAAFAAIALAGWWAGKTTCGCFGPFSPPPLAMAAIDVVLAAAFLRAPPARRQGGRPGRAIALSLAGAAALAGWWLAATQPALPTAPAAIDTTAWQRRVATDMASGTWIAVCYRDQCPHCRAGIAAWVQAAEDARAGDGPGWVFIDLDPAGRQGDLLAPFGAQRLRRLRRPNVLITAPLFLLVQGGRVIASSPVLEGLRHHPITVASEQP